MIKGITKRTRLDYRRINISSETNNIARRDQNPLETGSETKLALAQHDCPSISCCVTGFLVVNETNLEN